MGEKREIVGKGGLEGKGFEEELQVLNGMGPNSKVEIGTMTVDLRRWEWFW